MAGRHPNKEIHAAVEYAIARGWTLVPAGKSAHAWGILRCPAGHRESHQKSVYSTPRSPKPADQIRRFVDKCDHGPPGLKDHDDLCVHDRPGGRSEMTPEVTDALFEAGCDDGSLGRSAGVLSIDFDREAPRWASDRRRRRHRPVGRRGGYVRVEVEGPATW